MPAPATTARAAAIALLPLVLAGCADPDSGPAKVQAAIRDLGGTPQTTFEQPVMFNDLGTEDIRQQTLYLVAAQNGPGFTIVDEQDQAYRDYDDLLINNHLDR